MHCQSLIKRYYQKRAGRGVNRGVTTNYTAHVKTGSSHLFLSHAAFIFFSGYARHTVMIGYPFCVVDNVAAASDGEENNITRK